MYTMTGAGRSSSQQPQVYNAQRAGVQRMAPRSSIIMPNNPTTFLHQPVCLDKRIIPVIVFMLLFQFCLPQFLFFVGCAAGVSQSFSASCCAFYDPYAASESSIPIPSPTKTPRQYLCSTIYDGTDTSIYSKLFSTKQVSF